MKSLSYILVALFFGVFIALSGQYVSADESIQAEEDYFPLHVGDRWIYNVWDYDYSNPDGPTTIVGTTTRAIVKSETIGGKTWYFFKEEGNPRQRVLPDRYNICRKDENGDVWLLVDSKEILVFKISAKHGELYGEDGRIFESADEAWEEAGHWWEKASIPGLMEFIHNLDFEEVILQVGIGVKKVIIPLTPKSYRLKSALIDGKEFVFSDSVVESITWGRLKAYKRDLP